MARSRNSSIFKRIGDIWHRVAFDKRETVNPDSPADLGSTQSIFIEQFVVWSGIQAKFGGEAVLAARLTGTNTVLITVRQSSDTEQIKTDWRARNVHTGVIYNILSIVDPNDNGEFFEMLCQSGTGAA